MIKKILIGIVLLLVVLGVGGYFFLSFQMPKEKDFENLKEPKIREMASQRMLVVEMKGDPKETSGKAIGRLYQVYYKLPGVSKSGVAPVARWPLDFSVPADQWLGRFGLKLPGNITSLPEDTAEPKVKTETWEYGQVAEILHVGPYDQETPNINKLKEFIEKSGYQTVGEHEEEYIKSTGMLIPVKPKDYLTIIRYRIIKK